MSVTYIPAPTPGKDLFEASLQFTAMIEQAKSTALSQQLAASKLQSAQMEREILSQQLEMDRMKMNEFTSAKSKSYREGMMDQALEGAQLKNKGDRQSLDFASKLQPIELKSAQLKNDAETQRQEFSSKLNPVELESAQLRNDSERQKMQFSSQMSPLAVESARLKNRGDQQTLDFSSSLNPLHLLNESMKSKGYELANAKAEKEMSTLDDMLADQSRMRKGAIAAQKIDMQSKQIHSSVQQMLAPIKAAEALAGLEQAKGALKQQEQQNQLMQKNIEFFDQTRKAQLTSSMIASAKAAGSPGALRAIASNVGGDMAWLADLPDEIGMKTAEQAIMNHMINKARAGDETAIDALAVSLKGIMKIKDDNDSTTQLAKLEAMKKGVPYKDTTMDAMRNFAKSFVKDAKPNAQGYYDITQPFGTIPGMSEGAAPIDVRNGSPQIGNALGGVIKGKQKLDFQPGDVAPQTQQKPAETKMTAAPVESGQHSFEDSTVNESDDLLQRVEYHITQHPEVARGSFNANKKKDDVRKFMSDAPKPEFFNVEDDGEIVNPKAATKQWVSKRLSHLRGDVGSVMKNNFVSDESATTAQEARYRTAYSLVAQALDPARKESDPYEGKKLSADNQRDADLESGKKVYLSVLKKLKVGSLSPQQELKLLAIGKSLRWLNTEPEKK
jgi:hypothetical protein